MILQSYIAGRWVGERAAKPLTSAINGRVVAHTHEEGLDFAEAMIAIARERASAAGVESRCRWIAGDVMVLELAPADAVLAIGAFAYVDEPKALLGRLRELTRRELIASFPRAGTWQGVLRRAWLRMKNCPVRYYDVAELRALVASWDGEPRIVESIRGDRLLHWRRTPAP